MFPYRLISWRRTVSTLIPLRTGSLRKVSCQTWYIRQCVFEPKASWSSLTTLSLELETGLWILYPPTRFVEFFFQMSFVWYKTLKYLWNMTLDGYDLIMPFIRLMKHSFTGSLWVQQSLTFGVRSTAGYSATKRFTCCKHCLPQQHHTQGWWTFPPHWQSISYAWAQDH